jgi:uncharacterized glyoxalase superfamily protein PhnB
MVPFLVNTRRDFDSKFGDVDTVECMTQLFLAEIQFSRNPVVEFNIQMENIIHCECSKAGFLRLYFSNYPKENTYYVDVWHNRTPKVLGFELEEDVRYLTQTVKRYSGISIPYTLFLNLNC